MYDSGLSDWTAVKMGPKRDVIGDLALIGRPLLGHVIAERAGHAMHTALVAKVMSDPSLYDIVTFDQLASRVAESLVSV